LMRLPGISLANPAHLLAVGLGSGLAPRAPGTWGTLVAVPMYLVLDRLPPVVYLAFVIAAFFLGVWICGLTAQALGERDHPAIVWDEIVGFLVTMAAAPPGAVWILLGFLLFRGFDIWKPWPIRALDKTVHGGLGIMLDDVLAGLCALLGIGVLAAVLA